MFVRLALYLVAAMFRFSSLLPANVMTKLYILYSHLIYGIAVGNGT